MFGKKKWIPGNIDYSKDFDQVYDDMEDLGKLVKDLTELVKEQSNIIRDLKVEVIELKSSTKEAIRKEEEIHDVRDKLQDMTLYVQNMFAKLLDMQFTNKPASVSPQIQAYLERKNTNGTKKLPLP